MLPIYIIASSELIWCVRVIEMYDVDSQDYDYLRRRIATLQWDISMITNESVIAKKRQELEEYMAELESLEEYQSA